MIPCRYWGNQKRNPCRCSAAWSSGLSVKHLVRSGHGTQIADQTVCGRIGWDESEDGRVPLLVTDGQEVSWNEFGRMLMPFEGWRFRV